MTKETRRNASEIIEEIFKALSYEGTVSVAQMAKRLGTPWTTADRYLSLIWRIQHGPRVIAIRQEGTRNTNWRKEYGDLPKEVKS